MLQDDVFARAKTATRKAEEAAAIASAEAEKAVKLVSDAEISRKEVETIEKHHEEIRSKIEDTKIAVSTHASHRPRCSKLKKLL